MPYLLKLVGRWWQECINSRNSDGCLRVSRFTSAITAHPPFSTRQPELKPKLKSRVTRSFRALSAKMMRVKVLTSLGSRLRYGSGKFSASQLCSWLPKKGKSGSTGKRFFIVNPRLFLCFTSRNAWWVLTYSRMRTLYWCARLFTCSWYKAKSGVSK